MLILTGQFELNMKYVQYKMNEKKNDIGVRQRDKHGLVRLINKVWM